MNIPEDLRYAKSHEWVRVLENGLLEIGLSDYAQEQLGDIVFVKLPNIGDAVKAGSPFAEVESVKAVSDIYSPVNGTVREINEDVAGAPEAVNKSPYTAWLVRVEGVPEGLLSAAEYKALL